MATKQYEVTVCFPHSCSIKAVVLGNSVADALRAAHAQFPPGKLHLRTPRNLNP